MVTIVGKGSITGVVIYFIERKKVFTFILSLGLFSCFLQFSTWKDERLDNGPRICLHTTLFSVKYKSSDVATSMGVSEVAPS